MKLLFCLLLFFCCDVVLSQNPTVRRAQLLQYRAYVIDVVSETMQEVEDFHWCNLKIPYFSKDVKLEIFGRQTTGHISYSNGFVVSIQHVDIQQSFVQQEWRWNTNDQLGTVEVKARLRMHDVLLGFDVVAELNGTERRYTSTFTHQLLNFDFSILKDMKTDEITTRVTAVTPISSTGNMKFIPSDDISDISGFVFDQADTIPGIQSWGLDVFTPRLHNVVMNKVIFPTVCYNC